MKCSRIHSSLVHWVLPENLEKDATVGVDPWCISVETANRWEQALSKKGQKLIQLEKNLVDEVWKDRPLPEVLPISVHPLEYSGLCVREKLNDLRGKLAQENCELIILTALDELLTVLPVQVAWLYNIRGCDVSYNPVVHAFAIVTIGSAFFYVDKRKVTSEVG
eukprot:Gb_01878 [translate_table: standard]